jgi:hypothetical protein
MVEWIVSVIKSGRILYRCLICQSGYIMDKRKNRNVCGYIYPALVIVI